MTALVLRITSECVCNFHRCSVTRAEPAAHELKHLRTCRVCLTPFSLPSAFHLLQQSRLMQWKRIQNAEAFITPKTALEQHQCTPPEDLTLLVCGKLHLLHHAPLVLNIEGPAIHSSPVNVTQLLCSLSSTVNQMATFARGPSSPSK